MKKKKKISIVAIIILILLVGRACGGRSTSETKVEDQAKPETETSVAVEENAPAEEVSEESTQSDTDDTDTGVLSPEFKKTMDDYEAWFDHYCEVMKKYQENPSDMELLSEMGTLIAEEEKMLKQMESMDESEMNSVELAYYIDVTARIQKKLLEVANL